MRCIVSHDLLRGDDAVMQPVGHVLAGDAQRRAVFHQADIVDVGHLRAADALVDPAHDIAEDALGIVVKLALDLLRRPVRSRRDGNPSSVSRLARARSPRDCACASCASYLVVMGGVQRGRRRRRHPGGVGAGLGMADLLLQHRGHQVGHRPHALADLRLAGQAAF